MSNVVVTIKKVTVTDYVQLLAAKGDDLSKSFEAACDLVLRHTNLDMDGLLTLPLSEFYDVLRQVAEGIAAALAPKQSSAPWVVFTKMIEQGVVKKSEKE